MCKMRILMINKFLYPNGGSETYIFNLCNYLEKMGNDIEFFGMEDEKNIVSNSLDLNVTNMQFRSNSLKKLIYPFKIIYSYEAAKKIRKVLKKFKPDIVHINNFNFQITPSILFEIKKNNIPIVLTLHDFQIICPNHMMYLEHKTKVCEECKGRKYFSCIRNRCIHNSGLKSLLGAFEGWFYYKLKTYDKFIDLLIAPSNFLRNKVIEFGESETRIKVIHNFVNEVIESSDLKKQNYVLYFGRLSIQKGIRTLISVCKQLPQITFVFAGGGELEHELRGIKNIEYVGFKSGEDLKTLISHALFSIYPSEWYENCPMSVLESQMLGTPVIGANIGGIPELIDDGVDGLLFKPADINDLIKKIRYLYNNRKILEAYSFKCVEKIKRFSVDKYHDELMKVYNLAIAKNMKDEVDALWQKGLYMDQ